VEISEEFGIWPQRARTLPAGAVILAEVQRRLGVPLQVSRTGMREGVAASLLAQAAAA
jgi:exopolyphosphatase/pppGpp-phosphohydrolase